MVWVIALVVAIGANGGAVNKNDFNDGDKGEATWYGSTSGVNTGCYGGFRNTCNPYSKGEKLYYAAMGGHNSRKGSVPFKVLVVNTANNKSIVVTVRDHCFGCWADGTGGRLIDLSPLAFMAISTNGKLNLGVLKVRIYYGISRYEDLVSSCEGRRARLFC
jgi:hypothetical protein